MRLNEEQLKSLAARKNRLPRSEEEKRAQAAGTGLLLQEVLMAEERKAREASDQAPEKASPDEPSTNQ